MVAIITSARINPWSILTAKKVNDTSIIITSIAKSSDMIKMNTQEQGKEQVEYWENGTFQCKIEKKMAEEILKDHKHWGNRVKIDGDKFHVEIRGKAGMKGEKSKIGGDDLPAGQPTVGIGVAAGYVE